MCGIAGILLTPTAADTSPLRAIGRMAKALHHRGPDGEGLWTDREAGIALGHRRLAIVDLSHAGHQPMLSASGRFVISYNGEIYNFGDLRRELEREGQAFRGGSDTEVMLAAIEGWGLEPALRRFAGMFAFALWDRQARTLHFARDRLGKKPLYIARTRDALIFASELKALRTCPDFRPELDLDAASAMLAKGWVPDHQCIWRSAFKLAPGALLSLRADQLGPVPDVDVLRARVRSWWSLDDIAGRARRNLLDGDDQELTTELETLLQRAVRERMVADVPLGAFLSGGIDSATVVALMQVQSSKPVRTFTIAFGDAGYDESSQAAEVARHLGTEHTELRLLPDAAREVIPELPRVWDEPFADESEIPTLLVSRLARQHVTVALTGDGGDEGFAGYSRHFLGARLAGWHAWGGPLRRTSSGLLALLARGMRQDLFTRFPARLRRALRPDQLDRLARLLAAEDQPELYRRLVGTSENGLVRHPSRLAAEAPPLDDLVSRLLLDDATGYLPGDILVKLDRASMANSLETRCPLLDHRVIEFAWHLPTRMKVRNARGKWILRQLLGRHLPRRLIDRPKHGFDVPVGDWLRGPLREWSSDLLADLRREPDGLVDIGFIDVDRVDACWREHLAGRRDHSRDLWSVLMFQAWRREQAATIQADRYQPFALAGE
ncbi:asparagine synthase (glutamine-hydrolyzing) [Kaistia adipata]|uniref:asparagine synthase (glutamine-hydrolyzing) n=1 Tax=Kaistia adipata TaxID=166954 RepID=UPI0003FAF764|nr:asparagine synthase (glutamine-hydrolyzing) [Kaistia adipata]